jgi:asparagine synthase (glutamine-hydrolysing)
LSGIFGIVHFDGRPVDPGEVHRMNRAARARAVDGEAIWIDAAAAIGHHYSRVTPESIAERQPAVWDDAVLSFDGRLDNRDELIGCCPSAPPAESALSDAALVLAAYRTFGERCAARLVGDFAFAIWDARHRRLLLARDVMAARPLYYVSLQNGIAFASEIKSLLAHPAVAARPDEDGLADLLLNGYSDGHTTWFENIRTVPPGSVVAVSPDRSTVARAWEFQDREIRYVSGSEYVDHFRALFTQAVKRRLRSAHPVAVAVSGGLDSSAIHCEAARLGTVPVRGVTLAYPHGTPADEHEFIGVLRRRGLEIDQVPVDEVRWVATADRTVARLEMPSLMWEQQDLLLARARQAGSRVLLNGFFGDQLLTGEAYLVDLARRGHWRLVRRHLRETAAWMTDVDPRVLRWWFVRAAARAIAPAWMLRAARLTISRSRKRDVYPPWFTQRFRDRAFERAHDRCRQPRRIGSAHADECWRTATSGYYLPTLLQAANAGAAHELDTAYPFRDRDLVAFLMAIPGDVINEDGVPKAILRRSLVGVLPEPIRLRRWKGDGTAFSNGAARAEEQTIRRLLGPDSLSARAGFLDAGALRSRMPAIFGSGLKRDDNAVLGWQVGDTLGLELWLRHFCGGLTCN